MIFGYFWDDDRAIPNNPCSSNFHGDSAFSEPETRAIRVRGGVIIKKERKMNLVF